MKDITPILSALGLQDSEIKTYLKGLEAGPSTAAEISKLTKYSRQGTYTAIESLSDRGLMASVTRGKKKLYVAEPPSKLLAYAKRRDEEMHERVKDLERLAPELELQIGGERPIVKMYEGKAGLKAILADMKETRPKEVVEIADVESMYNILDREDLNATRNELDRIKSKITGIYTGIDASAKDAKSRSGVERYYLPGDEDGFQSDITVYGDKIALATFEGKMFSVLIESKPLAKAFRVLFKLATEELKRKKK